MSAQVPFVPGRAAAPGPPLARYRPRPPVGAASEYVRALTAPDDLVVDLFCQGATIVRETVAAGRRALGLSANPLLLTAARLGLSPPDPAPLNVAFTRLADSPKGDRSLHSHFQTLYRSACPVCDASGVAEWFAWSRDRGYPFEKAVRCPECERLRIGSTDGRDIEAARRVAPRGLAYYYALDRAAPLGHPARERAAELIERYTPRNLSALMDLSRRLQALEVDESVKIALTAVLLDCFDAGSKLDPYGQDRPRPRTLRIPVRYLERNVWLCFEEGLSRLLRDEPPSSVSSAADVEDLVQGEKEGYALIDRAARDARDVVPPGSVALLFADPPRPDGVFWALSALWASWLWESPAARRLRPFLRRRRFDWEWHWRALRRALGAAGPLLASDGHLITLFSDPDDALMGSVCLAASSAGYSLEGWGCAPEIGHRLIWGWKGAGATRPADVEILERDLTAVARGSILDALRGRGEPTSRSLLHAGVCAGLTERGLLADTAAVSEDDRSALSLVAEATEQALEETPLRAERGTQDDEALWWLVDPERARNPLADRVEATVRRLLRRREWDERTLTNAVYARFPGSLTPELSLVRTCIESYGAREGDTLHLRPEDDLGRRAAERERVRGHLASLGGRLGFDALGGSQWDVRWLESGREIYLFAISITAILGPYLWVERTADEEARRCLVVPGGRAGLIDLKLRRDPRLSNAVDADGWRFIKFRHLRRLMAKEDLDRHVFRTVFGLDPIVEQEVAQIPLF